MHNYYRAQQQRMRSGKRRLVITMSEANSGATIRPMSALPDFMWWVGDADGRRVPAGSPD